MRLYRNTLIEKFSSFDNALIQNISFVFRFCLKNDPFHLTFICQTQTQRRCSNVNQSIQNNNDVHSRIELFPLLEKIVAEPGYGTFAHLGGRVYLDYTHVLTVKEHLISNRTEYFHGREEQCLLLSARAINTRRSVLERHLKFLRNIRDLP